MKHIKYLSVVFFSFFTFQTLGFAVEQNFDVKTYDGLTLKGVLEIPSEHPKMLLIILPGTGNVDADGDVTSPALGKPYRAKSAKLSLDLAKRLADIGIASFRYEKRGFADQNQLPKQNLVYLIRDASSALEQIKAEFKTLKTGFVGFSEGALVAAHVSSQTPVDALFLMGLPTRSIDDTLHYQFRTWPVRVVSQLDTDHNGIISAVEIKPFGEDGQLPLLGPGFTGVPWKAVDPQHTGELNIQTQVVPLYERMIAAVMQLAKTPEWSAWYNSFKLVPAFSAIAGKISAPTFMYQAQLDAQVDAAWPAEDSAMIKSLKAYRSYNGLGHCFSPMEGPIGQDKTTGPMAQSVLDDLAADAKSLL